MWPIVIGAIVAAVLLLIAAVAMQPAGFKVKRTVLIAAPPAAIFPQVHDFHRWNDWSPWAKMDPDMKQTFEGAASGVGAVQTWDGKKCGTGRSTIVESAPNARVLVKLEFMKPWVATNFVEFLLEPEEEGTRVTWTMTGRKNFVMKAFSMVCNLDKTIGKDFEKGLVGIKGIVEAPAAADAVLAAK